MKKNYSSTQLGMLFGTFIGGGMGIILFALTNNVLWILLTGLGTGLGLSFGAAVEQNGKRNEKGGITGNSGKFLGEVVLIAGILAEVVGAIIYIFKLVPKDNALLPFLGLLGLILIGTGLGIKKKSR